ncbi:MAG: hypothetical protein ACYCXG_07915 [Acidiferrobacter sp.]
MPAQRALTVPFMLLMLLVACSRPASGRVEATVVDVTTGRAVVRSLPQWRMAVGDITAGAEPFVAAPVGGRVEAILVVAGEHIEAQSIVATMRRTARPGAPRSATIRVRAPAAATITQILVAPGTRVPAGTALVAVAGAHIRQARLPFLATVARRLPIGARVWLHSPLAPRSRLPGTVARVQSTACSCRAESDTPSRKAVYAYINLPPLAGFGVGTPVRAEVRIARATLVVVPAPSVVLRRPGTVVFVVNHHHVVMTRVHVALRQRHLIGLRSGLTAGAQVVVTGANQLHNGSPIHVHRPA